MDLGTVIAGALGALAALAGGQLTANHQRDLSRDTKLWDARAKLYLSLLQWVKLQESAMDDEDWGQLDLPLAEKQLPDLQARIDAFASDRVRDAFWHALYQLQVSRDSQDPDSEEA